MAKHVEYIMDEPTSGLDPLMQREFYELLEERNKEGATIFLSSHILSEVQKYCRHAAVIRDGKILACDTVDNLGHTGAKRVVLHGISKAPELDDIRDVAADAGTLALLYLAYFVMQLEIAVITFGISSFIRRGGMGIGLGLAAIMYFLNIISNLMEETKILKYVTPFGYTDGADIISEKAIHMGYMSVGLVVMAAAVVCAYMKYSKKDID